MSATSRRLVVATRNPGKQREIAGLLVPLGFKLCDLAACGVLPDVEEDADTFLANAKKKALHFSGLTGCWTLADDSGLEVDALGGAPGVRSARYAGPDKDDAANNGKLVAALRGLPPEQRGARFRCAVVVAAPQHVLCTAEGCIEGRIVDEPRGAGGFGYDPHFFIPALDCTMAELGPSEKNRVSHRGQALRRIAELLREVASA